MRYDSLNGVTLLNAVHWEFHRIYGTSKTLQQFAEFMDTFYGDVDNAWNRGLKNGPFSSEGDTLVLENGITKEKKRREV